MTLSSNDLRLFRSQTVSDSASNGGRLGNTEIGGGITGNLFPDAMEAERLAGSATYRKLFVCNRNPTDAPAHGGQVFMENHTPASDEIFLFAGTQTNTQQDLTGSEALYGVGQLNADASAGATSITVAVHDWAGHPIFRNGALLRISDKASIDAAGNTHFVEVHPTTAITAAGNVVTLPLASHLPAGFESASTRVASVLPVGDLVPAIANWIETTASGTYNEGLAVGTNRGTIEQNWTLTFTSASAYTVVGDTLGSVGSGTVAADFAPNHVQAGAAYFRLPAAGWGGIWAPGDTITFRTRPAAAPVWALRHIPPLTAPLAGNKAVLAVKVGAN